MTKIKKSQILILIVLVALLLLTPALPSSLRPKYLYFIINLLIIVVGAEAGLLSCLFSTQNVHLDPKKTPSTEKPQSDNDPSNYKLFVSVPNEKKKPVEICESESSRPVVDKLVEKVMKKCPSRPSLFFIGSSEDQEEDLDEINGQDLFTKSETFIGNFYKQLKIQREESWKRIHGFYHNHIAF